MTSISNKVAHDQASLSVSVPTYGVDNFSQNLVDQNLDDLQRVTYNVHLVVKEDFKRSNITFNKSKPLSFSRPFEQKIIRGAQGKVSFTASDTGSPLAVKEFFDSYSFKREVAFSKIVDGVAHCCHIRQIGKHPRFPHHSTIVMDKAGSKDLYDVIRNSHGLSEQACLKLLKQSLECLKDLHKEGVIHCDIKPGNIIWDEENDQYTIVDLGLSKLNSEREEKRLRAGTMIYGSPEIALNLEKNFAQDIWSLGILIYVAYTGRPFFSIINKPQINGNSIYALIWEIERIFGEFPKSMLEQMDPVELNAYKRWLKNNESTLETFLPVENFEDRIKLLPESLQTLLKKMCSYENRPSAEDLLKDEILKKDISFKIDFPDGSMYSNMDLVITSEVEGDDHNHDSETTVFSLGSKKIKRLCNHIPRSYNDKYKVQLKDKSGEILFENNDFDLIQSGTLEIK